MRIRLMWQIALCGVASFLLGCNDPSAHAADKDVPAAKLDMEVPKESKDAKEPVMQSAVFAGGCFWGLQVAFEQLKGVSEVVSGYAGGTKETATYEKVCSHTTDHAEAIKIVYDPKQITYGQLLRVFFTLIDPTTKDRQENDVGRNYRSAIFYANDEEKKVAAAYIKQLEDEKVFDASIVTTLEPLDKGFFAAEDYHQDYALHNPDQPYVRMCSLPKLGKVREHFPDLVKPAPKKAD